MPFNYFQSLSSSISELKYFSIFGCSLDNQNLRVTHIIHSGTKLQENLIIKNKCSTKSVNEVLFMVMNILNWIKLLDKSKDCIYCATEYPNSS